MADVVLIESFYGGSHRAWADAWAEQSRHRITLITHPDEFWRWRLRGAAVTLAAEFGEHVGRHGRPDAVVLGSMIDAASFAGLARSALHGVPIALYLHESQVLYPTVPGRPAEQSTALTNWRSMVAADRVWFNSSFHRSALLAALPRLLGEQGEPRHEHLIAGVFDRSQVLWPGVATADLVGEARPHVATDPLLLWNQRWDHDKNPGAVFAALADLADDGVAFRVALAGENRRASADELGWFRQRHGDRIVHTGYRDPASYRALLLASDVVASAADHEFFGIAVVEAIAAGAVPVLPNRLSFPELIGPQWHDAVLYPDGGLRARLRAVLGDIGAARRAIAGLRASMERFDSARSAAAHDKAVDELIATA